MSITFVSEKHCCVVHRVFLITLQEAEVHWMSGLQKAFIIFSAVIPLQKLTACPEQRALLSDEWTAGGIEQLFSCHPTAEAEILSRAASTVVR